MSKLHSLSESNAVENSEKEHASEFDLDNDGLLNEDEDIYGTDRLHSDTDRDGVTDSFEVENGFDPLNKNDHPFESLSIYETTPGVITSTTGNLHDSDGDGLSDTYERELGLNPTLADTDLDGMKDGVELLNETNPTEREAPQLNDIDGDGLHDGIEVILGSNPNLADTDRDSLRDSFEFLLGLDPRNPDSDKDGVLDGWYVAKTKLFEF